MSNIPGANHSHSLNESLHGFNHTSNPSVSSRLPPFPANETGIYTTPYTSKPATNTHQPFTKSSGLFVSNATSGFAKLTGTGPSIHPSGTGVSSKVSKMCTHTRLSSRPKPVTSSSEHLPYTKICRCDVHKHNFRRWADVVLMEKWVDYWLPTAKI